MFRNALQPGALWFIGLVTLFVGCTRMPDTERTTLRPGSLSKLQRYLLGQPPDLAQFMQRGPFSVSERPDRELPIAPNEHIEADLYLASAAEKAPLVIIAHGHDNAKEDHGYQAHHLATWGIHSIAVQLPNEGPWIENGRVLARLVNLIYRNPEIIDRRVDRDRILLVGHSFGASSVAVALAEGAPAAGAILLDPAGVNAAIPGYLKRIRKPVMLLTADARVFLALNRSDFYQYVPEGVAEVSITGAHHEDAQFALEPQADEFDSESSATEELQITFAGALAAAAFSLGTTGKLDYAWNSFADALKSGKLFGAARK